MCPTHSAPSEGGVQQVNGANGEVNGHVAVETPVTRAATTPAARANGHARDGYTSQPFKSRAEDLLSNVSNFKIIESTLRGKEHP